MSDTHAELGAAPRMPTVVLPDPHVIFARRASRFRVLAPDHQLEPYLLFLGDLSEAQHLIQPGLPDPAIPPADEIGRSISFGMPILRRTPLPPHAAVGATILRLLEQVAGVTLPDPARAALFRLRHADALELAECIEAVLTDNIAADAIAEHVFIGAALQVHFARAAASLRTPRIASIGDFICPVCGAPPASSGIIGWPGAERTRFCTCSLCATRWNAVRVKCLACSSTKGISYQAIEGLPDTIKAECCDECRSYVKIFAEDADTLLEPIADDVASLGLDMLVREAGYRRAGANLFLLGC